MKQFRFYFGVYLGSDKEWLLSEQRVLPKQPLEAGYKFKYNDLEKALKVINN